MRSYKRISTGVITLDRDGIAQAQNIVATTPMTLNGAVGATLSPPRRVSIYSAADVTTANFVIVGKDRAGATITETIAGPNNATVTGSKVFSSITSITPSTSIASNVEVGFIGDLVGGWLFLGHADQGFAWEAEVAGTATYSIQQTFRNVLREGATGDNQTTSDLQASGSASARGKIDYGIGALRIVQTAGSGTVTLRVIPAKGR